MKILVTGRAIPTQPDRCTGQQLAEGFRQLGHECVFYGCFYGQPYRFLGAKEVQEEDFDLVVVTEMNDGMPGYDTLFSYYRLRNVPRLYWDFDVSYHPDVSFKRAGAISYDAFLVGNIDYLTEFTAQFGKPAIHLPYACSPQIHRRMPEIQREHIVGFVGQMTPERTAMLGNVHNVQGVFGDDLIIATNRLHTMVHVNQDACKGLVPGRPWETSGCGTNLLMDRPSYEDFKPFLPEHLDDFAVKVFDTRDDIEDYVKHWMNVPEEERRESLDRSGRQLMEYVHNMHSYKRRAEMIVAWCQHEGIL